MKKKDNELIFRGQLQGKNCDISYQFKLFFITDNRLGFNILINNSVINRTFLIYKSNANEKLFGFERAWAG